MTIEAVLRAACKRVCQSGRFETGEGTCAAVCMGQLGYAREGCPHVVSVFGNIVHPLRNTKYRGPSTKEFQKTETKKVLGVGLNGSVTYQPGRWGLPQSSPSSY